MAEIEFAGWTGDGMVRQAAFKGLRADKPAEEVEAETPKKNKKLAEPKAAKASRVKQSRSSVVMDMPISHPDKALWPDAGDGKPVTKLDLARYYEAIGDWMLPHIKGRPCSHRARAGRHRGRAAFLPAPCHGRASPTCSTQVNVSGDRKPYLQIDRVEALAAVAQAGGLELHPWNCAPGKPDVPGRFVFDLDPAPDLDFDDVIAAAKELKERLEELGLVPFAKTTGGKGLHVVTPFEAGRASAGRKPRPSRGKSAPAWRPTARTNIWSTCPRKSAAEKSSSTICATTAWRRRWRRFARAPATAPPSPCRWTWSAVKKGLDPKRFTVRTAPALIAKSKAWKDYAKAEKPLLPVLKKLALK